MAIAKYTDIISLQRAKAYLRIDDTLSDDNIELTSMINGAFLFMERYTSHIFKTRQFELFGDGEYSCVKKVYQFPIISVDPESTTYRRTASFTEYTLLSDTAIKYTAGYANVEDVPDDFMQAALQIIKVWYFEAEKQVNESMIPMSVKQVLDTYRRFV